MKLTKQENEFLTFAVNRIRENLIIQREDLEFQGSLKDQKQKLPVINAQLLIVESLLNKLRGAL